MPRFVRTAPLALLLVFAIVPGAGSGDSETIQPAPDARHAPRDEQRVACRNRRSHSPGTWTNGRLRGGVLLPVKGKGFVTWSFRKKSKLNPSRYRWGTCRVVKLVLRLARDFRRDHPSAPRLLIGDLSRRHGGPLSGHASHQRGLDVDVYYPRDDSRERDARRVSDIDAKMARELVDRFLRAGAYRIYVGPATGLDRSGERVDPWPNHDNHLHARFRPRASDRP